MRRGGRRSTRRHGSRGGGGSWAGACAKARRGLKHRLCQPVAPLTTLRHPYKGIISLKRYQECECRRRARLRCSVYHVEWYGGVAARRRDLAAVMVMERLADFVSKSLEGGEAPAPPPEPGDDEADEEVDITALEDKAPPAKRPRNWLLSPPPHPPPPACKRDPDDDDDSKHGNLLNLPTIFTKLLSKTAKDCFL